MAPIVIRHGPVILLDGQQPFAETTIIDVEIGEELHVDEHPQTGFKGVGVFELAVVEGEGVQFPAFGNRDLGAEKILDLVHGRRNVEGQTLNSHLGGG